MNRSTFIWPIIIVVSAAITGLLYYADIDTPIRPLVVFWFLLVIPGMSFVRMFQIRQVVFQWTVAIVFSLALDSIVASFMVFSDAWLPGFGLGTLIGISLLGVFFQVVAARQQTNQPDKITSNELSVSVNMEEGSK